MTHLGTHCESRSIGLTRTRCGSRTESHESLKLYKYRIAFAGRYKKRESPSVRESEESEKIRDRTCIGFVTFFGIELKVAISHRFWTETIRTHLWPFTISDR